MSDSAETPQGMAQPDDGAHELRLTVEDQAGYIAVLLARLEHVAGQEVELRALGATLGEQVARADAEHRRLEAELAQARAEIGRLKQRLVVRTASDAKATPSTAAGMMVSLTRDELVARLEDDVTELQAALKARDEAIAWLQGELALTERRVGRATVKVVGRFASVYRRLALYFPGRRR
ncbi:MAG: hypothetical protein KIT87_09040 [Anaerolineae bacterium]|nr:hypothetical protein [Anaerolineae bacterium]